MQLSTRHPAATTCVTVNDSNDNGFSRRPDRTGSRKAVLATASRKADTVRRIDSPRNWPISCSRFAPTAPHPDLGASLGGSCRCQVCVVDAGHEDDQNSDRAEHVDIDDSSIVFQFDIVVRMEMHVGQGCSLNPYRPPLFSNSLKVMFRMALIWGPAYFRTIALSLVSISGTEAPPVRSG